MWLTVLSYNLLSRWPGGEAHIALDVLLDMEVENGCYGAVKTTDNISVTDSWIGWLVCTLITCK